ncbi:MAG: hypothetical protein DSZ05_01370, partial [Sulfurospirillum sp.]
MKILKLRALNINSLKGETQIDFEAWLCDNPLFAITGPTGAGKSTLLDIISCALYGRTARLTNPAELMSENSGEAFCEVEFEVSGRSYRAFWGQRRARGKADGKLQPPKMELCDLGDDKIIESKMSQVPKRVEALTGLDFVRFSQSMMLAQGSFDAFLKAKEAERSNLLEKITGTHIYTVISQKVYEKFTQLEQRLKIEKEKLGMITLMEREERQALEKELSEITERKTHYKTQITAYEKQIAWLREKEKLEKEAGEAATAFAEISEEKEAHREDFVRLERAKKALKLEGLYRQREEVAGQLWEDEKHYASLLEEQQQLSQTVAGLREKVEEGELLFEKEQKAYRATQQKLTEARKLLVKEQAARADLQERQRHLMQLHEREKKLQTEKDRLCETIEVLEEEQVQTVHFLDSHREDAVLGASLGLLEAEIGQYASLMKELRRVREKVSETETAKEEKQKLFTQQKAALDTAEAAYQKALEAYRQTEEKYQKLILGKVETQKAIAQKERFLDAATALHEVLAQKRVIGEEAASLRERLAGLEKEYRALHEHLTELKTLISALQVQKEQQMLLQKYEADRLKLKEGEPCFLCGATEHPYVQHHIEAKPDMLEKEIGEKEEKQEKLQRRLEGLREKLVEYERDIAHAEKALSQKEEEAAQYRQVLDAAGLVFSDDTVQHLQDEVEVLRAQLRDMERIASEREDLLRNRDEKFHDLEQKRRMFTDTDKSLALLKNEVDGAAGKVSELEKRVEEVKARISERLSSFGEVFVEALQEVYKRLQQRFETFTQMERKREDTEKLLQEKALQKGEFAAALKSLHEEMKGIRSWEAKLREVIEVLQKERLALLNVADLDLYASERETAFRELERRRQERREELGAKESTLEALQKQLHDLTERISGAKVKAERLSQEFESALQESGFADVEAFHEALPQKEEMERLQILCSELQSTYEKRKTVHEERAKKLEAHLKAEITVTLPPDTIKLTLLEQSPKCYANAKFSSAEGSRADEPRLHSLKLMALTLPP